MTIVKIAIIGAEVKSIPAVEGGAVETIVDTFLTHNEKTTQHEITVYAKFNERAAKKISMFRYAQGCYVKVRPIGFFSKAARKLGVLDYRKKYIGRIIKRMNGKTYDWILIENRPEFVIPIRKAFPSAKIAVHVHNTYLSVKTRKAKDILDAADRIITVSDFIADGIKKINQRDAWKVKTLINRIDINTFKPKTKRHDLLEKYRIHAETLTVVTHGRIVKDKGILEAIQAIKKAGRQYNHLKLMVIGDLNSANLIYKRMIQKEVKDARIGSIVFTGYVDHDQVPDYLNLADIIILPSIWDEPCALTILESLSVGKPVITTNTGGTPEIVSHGSGILVNADTQLVDRLASRIVYLAKHREVRQIYAEKARNFAVRHLDDKIFFTDFLGRLEG
ncbi:glycosyltransferase family 1 protein [Sporolactobacillus sp. THM7-7]|nr:glycosyltransferase family 1 protein [Sporolactobacillus sp. THM7-7]